MRMRSASYPATVEQRAIDSSSNLRPLRIIAAEFNYVASAAFGDVVPTAESHQRRR